MPTNNHKINVVLDRSLYNTVHDFAQDQGISMSLVMRDLVKEAVELREDLALATLAESREKSFDPASALSHDEVWGA